MDNSFRVVIGVGTGRCGTHSLAALLNAQPGVGVAHETRPLLPWDNRRGGFSLNRRFEILHEKFRCGIVGDVALYYLNYIERLLSIFPQARVVGLKRDREETAKSFERWLRRQCSNPFLRNHYAEHCVDPWSECFPTFAGCSLLEGARLYWDEYYRILEALARKHSSVRIWPTEALSTDSGVNAILDHIEMRGNRRIVHPHISRTSAPPLQRDEVAMDTFFARAVCLSNRSSNHLWDAFTKHMDLAGWPFGNISRCEAMNERVYEPSSDSQHATFSLQTASRISHLRLWEEALNDEVDSLLVFEEGQVICAEFAEKCRIFLNRVPEDWDLIVLGGRHALDSVPRSANDSAHIADSLDMILTYAIRQPFLRRAYSYLLESGFRGAVCNAPPAHPVLGELLFQLKPKSYCPSEWLVGTRGVQGNCEGFPASGLGVEYNNGENPITRGHVYAPRRSQ